MKFSTNFLPILSVLVLTSCHGNVSLAPKSMKSANMHAGSAYSDSFQAALCAGEAYEEGKDTGENGDLYLPPGEHPLDDENIDDWDGTLGDGYRASIKACFMACQWPDEYPGSDEEGAAYRESQAAAEDADCHEDE